MDNIHPAVTVFLEDIAQKLDETMDGWEQYLNLVTGELETVSDGTYVEPDAGLLRELERHSGDYLRLPNQYELHEYRIMEDLPI